MKPPRLAQQTLAALEKVITGDKLDAGQLVAPYQSGPRLISFFNQFGTKDEYPFAGGISRGTYVDRKLTGLNNSLGLVAVIEAAVTPVRFLNTDFNAAATVEFLNSYLAYDGFVLVLTGKKYRFRQIDEPLVRSTSQLPLGDPAAREFIEEQLAKCDRKLQDGDHDGAITNARSLLEAVLSELERRLVPEPPAYDGDLVKLYKRVQKVMNLDPARPDIADSLRPILAGLVSVVAGLAPLRNKMSDAHVRTHKPHRHHAKLAVNAARTITDFLIDSFEFQKTAGRIQELRL